MLGSSRMVGLLARASIAVAVGALCATALDHATPRVPLNVADDIALAPTPINFSPVPPPFIDAIPASPNMTERSSWDAEPPPSGLRARTRALSSSSFIVVHHSDFDSSPGAQAILDYHRSEAGFTDIGYHVVVERDGAVKEGRAMVLVGAHAGVAVEQKHDKTRDPDEDSIGVVLDGDYMRALPPPAQLAAAAAVIRELRVRYGIPAHRVIGHRDVKSRIVEARGFHLQGEGTVCPGDAAYDVLPALRLFSEPL